jgi:hypothetical protein
MKHTHTHTRARARLLVEQSISFQASCHSRLRARFGTYITSRWRYLRYVQHCVLSSKSWCLLLRSCVWLFWQTSAILCLQRRTLHSRVPASGCAKTLALCSAHVQRMATQRHITKQANASVGSSQATNRIACTTFHTYQHWLQQLAHKALANVVMQLVCTICQRVGQRSFGHTARWRIQLLHTWRTRAARSTTASITTLC